MKILTYSPNIEVYVACDGNGSVSYYDLSPDVTRANVQRKVDGVSTFSIHLQNKSGKYDDIFTPMDRVKIYLTKTQRYPILSGYIENAPKFTAYNSEVEISGCCTIGRLQKLYWDAQLYESQELLGKGGGAKSWDTVLYNLLCGVGGFNDSTIKIGSMPQKIIDWAYGLYEKQQTEIGQLTSAVNEFYQMLQTTGPQLGNSGGSVSSGTVGNGTTIEIPSSVNQTGIVGDYTAYVRNWAANTGQRAVYDKWRVAGQPWDNKIAKLDGRYIIAVAPMFGQAGDKIDVLLEDGTVINALIGDIKGSDKQNEYGHVMSGKVSVVEFEAQNGFKTADVPDAWRGKKVKSITNCGSIL